MNERPDEEGIETYNQKHDQYRNSHEDRLCDVHIPSFRPADLVRTYGFVFNLRFTAIIADWLDLVKFSIFPKSGLDSFKPGAILKVQSYGLCFKQNQA